MTRRNKRIPFIACDNCMKFIELGQSLPEGECPFQYKPNLKIAVRRHYRMKCFCGEEFACPAQVVRYKGRPYCGSCLGDAISSDQDDGSCPTAEDDQRAVDRWLVDRYGEC